MLVVADVLLLSLCVCCDVCCSLSSHIIIMWFVCDCVGCVLLLGIVWCLFVCVFVV